MPDDTDPTASADRHAPPPNGPSEPARVTAAAARDEGGEFFVEWQQPRAPVVERR